MMVFYGVWSVCGLLPWVAMGHASVFSEYRSVGGAVASVFALGAFGWNFACAFRLRFREGWCPRSIDRAVMMGIGCVFLLPITRLMLPWEEPGTGMGSPLAVVMGVFLGLVAGGGAALLSGLIGLVWLRGYRARAAGACGGVSLDCPARRDTVSGPL